MMPGSTAESASLLGYKRVVLDGQAYLVNFNNSSSVRKFARFLSEIRDIDYRIFEEQQGGRNVVVYNANQYEVVKDFNGLNLHYFDHFSKPEQPINCSSTVLMFCKSVQLSTLDLSHWDVSGIKDTSWMFQGCASLVSLNLTGWHLNKNTKSVNMFAKTPIEHCYRNLSDAEILRKLGGS